MSTKFPPTTNELLEEFADMPDWDERYEYLVELGRELPELSEEHKSADNLVEGCMSTVWLVASVEPGDNGDAKGRLVIAADSDSLIVKGLIVVLLSIYANKSPEEVVQADEKGVFAELGLDQHLSANRRNGLFSMVARIKQLATEIAAKRA